MDNSRNRHWFAFIARFSVGIFAGLTCLYAFLTVCAYQQGGLPATANWVTEWLSITFLMEAAIWVGALIGAYCYRDGAA